MNLKPKRSLNAFDLSHASYGSCNLAQLIPVLCIDVLPGDTIDCSQIALLRFEAMTVPQYQTYKVKFHTFYCPERVMMPKYHDDFITGGKDGTDDTVWPYMVSPNGGYGRGSLGDYLGYACNTLKGDGEGQTNQIDGTFEHSAYPNRMYAKIVNHYFLNENAENELPCSEDPGLDETTNTDIFTPNWQKTYETGVLPDTERGDPVYIPIGTSAPVITTSTPNYPGVVTPSLVLGSASSGNAFSNAAPVALNMNGDGTLTPATSGGASTAFGAFPANLVADLSDAISARYDEFQLGARVSYLQRLNMRAGYKLVEWTLAHFGVRVPDATIQEPIYLGGGSGLVYISPVEQTSATSEVSPQGNLAGRGTAYVKTSHIRRTFTQHGWIMTLMSIMPTPSYSQGLAKRFQRKTRWDYALPVMDGAGDDKVMNNEIYVSGSNVTAADGSLVDEKEFGYKPRNEEYRCMSDDIHGEMRKGGSLEEYTASRFFGNKPVYGKSFVKADPSYRGFAVTDDSIHHVTYSIGHNIRMLRPLSLYGDPGLI